MQINDSIRKCTAFVGFPTERGFRPEGTGFFASFDEGGYTFYYFITAGHIAWPNRRRSADKFPNGPLSIRVNSKSLEPAIVTTSKDDWIFPEDKTVDICAIPTAWTGEDQIIGPSNIDEVYAVALQPMTATEAKLKTLGVTVGEEIFIVSAFIGRVGERRNIPIVRIGNISAMPEEPVAVASPKKGAYLIETRSLGGTSGSPIFLNINRGKETERAASLRFTEIIGPRKTAKTMTILPYFLLGMILGSHSGQYVNDFISEKDTDIDFIRDADFNAGISVALPALDILDFVENGAAMQTHRASRLEKLSHDAR